MTGVWHGLEPGPAVSEVIHMMVKIPRGSCHNYEMHKSTGVINLDRVLQSPVFYPGDCGFMPQSFYNDGDSPDVLLITNAPTFPGCIVEAHPVGSFHLVNYGEHDDKLLAVPQNDPFFADTKHHNDLPSQYLKEMTHFFSVFKDLEGRRTESMGWEGPEDAMERVKYSIDLYRDMRADRLGSK